MRSPDTAELADPEAAAADRPSLHLWRLPALVAAVIALGILVSWYLVAVILAIVVCVVLHELGHYLAATRSGMKVTEFFVGFGPRIWSFRRGEVEYGIKAIPAGAYVRIIGMTSADEVPEEDEARTYRRGTFWQRWCVAVAGSAMHFAIALVLIWTVLVFSGTTDPSRWVIGQVVEGSAAASASLQSGDRVVAIDGERVSTFAGMTSKLKERPGQTLRIDLERDGETRTVDVTLGTRAAIWGTVGEDLALSSRDGQLRVSYVSPRGALAGAGLRSGDPVVALNGVPVDDVDQLKEAVARSRGGEVVVTVDRGGVRSDHAVDLGSAVKLGTLTGFLGVGQELVKDPQSPLSAVGQSFARFGDVAGRSIVQVAALPLRVGETVSRAIRTRPGADAAKEPTPAEQTARDELRQNENRPVSIIGAVSIGSTLAEDTGWAGAVQFLFLFNVVIGLFNLLPFPPLDGGHVVIACYERIREKLRGGTERYMADPAKLNAVAIAVLVVLITMGVAAMYLDLADPIRL